MDNWKAIAYLLGFGQGLILCASLIVRGLRGQRASLFLGLILLVLVQEILNAWGMQLHYHSRPDAFHFWNFQSYLVLPLATWFFVKCTTEPAFRFKRKHRLLFLPVAVEIAVRWIWQLCWDIAERPIPSLLANPLWFFTTEILPMIGMVAVLIVYGTRLFDVWNKQKPAWTLYPRYFGLFVFLSLLTLLWIAGVIFEWPVFTGVELLITVCLFALGYTGYIAPDFFTLPAPEPILEKPAEKPEFARFDDERELQTLRNLFLDEHLHVRPGLTLEEVAGQLRLPARYISHLINTYCGTNFNGFVNAFRVDEVLRKLADPKEQHKTILALALDAGFSSKSTFNQVFRQHTGQSPSQFLQMQKRAGIAAATGRI